MRELDPLLLPLTGIQLIEAGAGTGKTYNITLLYLRLLLERGLDVEQILVVTFTEAAAAELRGRIRLKLVEMRGQLESDGGGDPVLRALAERLVSRQQAAERLDDVLRRLDQACVFTIHGFCARALAEHAFESGAPFETEFLSAEGPVLRSVAADFWRARFYTKPVEEARRLQTIWSKPEGLWKAATPLLRLDQPTFVPNLGSVELRQLAETFKAKNRREEVFAAAVLRDALGYMRGRFAEHKRACRMLSFDDLLGDLDGALGSAEGETLKERIRCQYPVALIDEFQDTDPVQYRIFGRIHGERQDCGLFLIGDPKQAIYGFRGADIYTYRRASEDRPDPGAAYSLTTNWRSSADYLLALNRLFSRQNPFVLDWIRYREARPSDELNPGLNVKDELVAAPFQVFFLSRTPENSNRRERIAPENARSLAAAACAREIGGLLRSGERGQAVLNKRPLQAGDIAILVRSGNEARQMRQALQSLGLGSVLHSRDSVAATAEAAELARVLAALVEPRSSTLLRAALSTRLMGHDACDLEALEADEHGWSEHVARFEGYREQWLRRGFAVMYRVLLHSEGIAQRVLADADGERRMTDLLHLGELLQEMESEVFGMDSLLRQFADLRADPDGDNEAQQLRLESDENLIRIVTIHKSKGLEYPIVFVPFPWFSKPVARKPPYVYHDPDSGQVGVYLGDGTKPSADHYWELAERDRLAEDLRLLYVAFTRAKHRCYFCWGRVEGASKSALAYLLHGADPGQDAGPTVASLDELSDVEIVSAIERLFTGAPDLLSISDAVSRSRAEVVAGTPLPSPSRVQVAQKLGKAPRQNWESTSYSGLLAMSRPWFEGPDHDWVEDGHTRVREVKPGDEDIFNFPRGARAGEMIHALLEELDFQATTAEVVRPLIRRHLQRGGFELRWAEVLERMLGELLDCVLESDSGLRLRDVPLGGQCPELEFHYALERVSYRKIIDLLASFGYSLPASDPARSRTLNGVMHGFVDLVLEHCGRYYLLDYKSNHLGDDVDDYAPESLLLAMREHHYELQYLIYVVALHRYLRYRLPGYDYQEHFGGVLYLFVRGIRKDSGATRGVYFSRPEEALIRGLDRLFSGEGGKRH
jgi:exodeoxyribonuclease V beta subunit